MQTTGGSARVAPPEAWYSVVKEMNAVGYVVNETEAIPRRWAECHYFIDESLLVTSYCSLQHWVSQNYAKSIFEDEIRLASEGIIIKRIYIYDTDEELSELKESENVKFSSTVILMYVLYHILLFKMTITQKIVRKIFQH